MFGGCYGAPNPNIQNSCKGESKTLLHSIIGFFGSMDNLTNQAANFNRKNNNLETGNPLWQYVTSMDPEVMARLSQPTSEDVLQVMERHVVSLLGHLPSDHFDVMVTTNRENLGRLMASAMMNGYFLRAAEQRMAFEGMVQDDSTPSTENI